MKINFNCIAAAALMMLVSLPVAAKASDKSEAKRVKREIATPKAGDFSFGVDMLPIINFLGNAFNNTNDQSLDNLSGSPVSISQYSEITAPTASLLGRYMLTDEWGVRVNLGIIVDNFTDSEYVTDNEATEVDPLSQAKVTDQKKYTQSGASIAVGLERRVGKGRIQGVFSANALYMYSIANQKYSYGNAITSINQTPDTAFELTAESPVVEYMPNMRPISERGGATHTIGLMGTMGVEWFVASQISIGLEIDIIAAYSKIGQEYSVYEGYNTATEGVSEYTEISSPKSRAFYMNTGCFSSNFTLNFYF